MPSYAFTPPFPRFGNECIPHQPCDVSLIKEIERRTFNTFVNEVLPPYKILIIVQCQLRPVANVGKPLWARTTRSAPATSPFIHGSRIAIGGIAIGFEDYRLKVTVQ